MAFAEVIGGFGTAPLLTNDSSPSPQCIRYKEVPCPQQYAPICGFGRGDYNPLLDQLVKDQMDQANRKCKECAEWSCPDGYDLTQGSFVPSVGYSRKCVAHKQNQPSAVNPIPIIVGSIGIAAALWLMRSK
jgi:hypothetical protein